ncbi:hypothetical protein VTL71DRAFT_14837 [Oculimacula yallundae]|uniref:EKC/KEOPS complex subunit BUD32 n=1 Tax=Oculimacula yallundae TaxID=86028 RepID=A0ABR4CFH0_9HELO
MSDSGTLEDVRDNGLMAVGLPKGLEKIYDYESGGHHPVHLGDLLDGHYKVIHKLGSGGYANVWLCSDDTSISPRYLAVKIIMAEGSTTDCPELHVNKLVELGLGSGTLSEHFCLPLHTFDIDGPNGHHYCFVYPVLGPRVSRLLNIESSMDPGSVLRKLSLQVSQALSILHSHGFCHGDLRPANILIRITGLDGLSEDQVLEGLGSPVTTKVVSVTGDPHDQVTAPQYLVYPICWDDVELTTLGAEFISEQACIIDFGESFDLTSPPEDMGIPQVYCSPEYTLDRIVDVGTDIWSLGCTIFEIRIGRKLFDTFDDDQDEYLWKMAMLLGKLPEPWWSQTWTARKTIFEDNTDDEGRVVEVPQQLRPSENGEPEIERTVVQVAEPRSIKEAIARGLFYENRNGPGGVHIDIPEPEVELLADLLANILKYDPVERITARQVSEHAWFKM